MVGYLSILLNVYPRCPNTVRSLNNAFTNTSDCLLNPMWFLLQYSGSEDQPLLHHNKEKEKHSEGTIKCVIKFLPYKSRKKGEKRKILKCRPCVMCIETYFVKCGVMKITANIMLTD